MSCRAARSRLPVPPAGRHSGRGPATARRSDREHPHPHRWSLLLQACAGPVCPGRGDKAGRSALPSRPCIGHIIGAGSRQHQLRYRHSLTQKRRRRLSTCGQIASSLRVGPKAASSWRVSDRRMVLTGELADLGCALCKRAGRPGHRLPGWPPEASLACSLVPRRGLDRSGWPGAGRDRR